MKLSNRANRLLGQKMFQIKNKAEELEREGKNLIHLEIGDSCFDTPKKVKKAIIKAIKQNKTHYEDPKGLMELRQKIAKFREVDVEEVLICPANFQIFISLSLLCNKGDEVCIPKPYFPTYKAVCSYLDLKIVHKPTKKTKATIYNSPRNPDGKYNQINALKSCLIIDNAYEDIVYSNGMNQSYIYKKKIEMYSFSKSHSMPGFRLGYMIAPKEIIDKAGLLIETTVSCFPTFIQEAGIQALDIEYYKMKELEKRRNLMVKGFRKLGFEVEYPDGGIYCWVETKNFLGKRETGKSFASFALANGVVVCPGEVFGQKYYFRVCFARPIKDIEEGLRRLR